MKIRVESFSVALLAGCFYMFGGMEIDAGFMGGGVATMIVATWLGILSIRVYK